MSKLCSVPKRHGSNLVVVLSVVAVILGAFAVMHFWASGKHMDTLAWVLIIPAVVMMIVVILRER